MAGFFNNGGGGYILVGIVNGNGTHMFHVDGSGDGYFAGDLNVGGTLTKGGGSFKIDDPIDPANKTLSHSFVESPDMMNIYNGLIRLDARGEAWVELPEYFDALNRDFRYQPRRVGQRAWPRLYVTSGERTIAELPARPVRKFPGRSPEFVRMPASQRASHLTSKTNRRSAERTSIPDSTAAPTNEPTPSCSTETFFGLRGVAEADAAEEGAWT